MWTVRKKIFAQRASLLFGRFSLARHLYVSSSSAEWTFAKKHINQEQIGHGLGVQGLVANVDRLLPGQVATKSRHKSPKKSYMADGKF